MLKTATDRPSRVPPSRQVGNEPSCVTTGDLGDPGTSEAVAEREELSEVATIGRNGVW